MQVGAATIMKITLYKLLLEASCQVSCGFWPLNMILEFEVESLVLKGGSCRNKSV